MCGNLPIGYRHALLAEKPHIPMSSMTSAASTRRSSAWRARLMPIPHMHRTRREDLPQIERSVENIAAEALSHYQIVHVTNLLAC